MRWILICCFLLATATDVLSTNRPKRDLWSIKNYISSKLFGTETVVIQLPKIPKDEAYQLFKIKGYDNILLKVTRKPEKEKPATEKPKDPIMVSPEIAIIGNYLGTTTKGETLLALEIAKNLLKSGILKDKTIVQVREPTNSVNVLTRKRDPMYIVPATDLEETIEIVNRQPVAVYQEQPVAVYEEQPVVVASEIQYRPLQTKYSYKQEGENADMMYESYDNQNVIVTRTDKVPEKPQYVALRLAEVASIAANPYVITTHQPVQVRTKENFLKSFSVEPVLVHLNDLKELSDRIPNNEQIDELNESADVPNFIKQSKVPFDIRNHLSNDEVDKLNKFINSKLSLKKIKTTKPPPRPANIENASDENMDSEQLDATGLNGDLVSRYVYQQMGDDDQDNYTYVNIEDPNLNQTKVHIVKSDDKISQDYVYVPPMTADAPPPNVALDAIEYELSNEEANFQTTAAPGTVKLNNEGGKYHPNSSNRPNNIVSKLPPTPAPNKSINKPNIYASTATPVRSNNEPNKFSSAPLQITSKDDLGILGLGQGLKQSSNKTGTLKTNVPRPWRKSPIVVAETDPSQSKVRSYQPRFKTTTATLYNGGPVFKK